jgi:hypothetical protein
MGHYDSCYEFDEEQQRKAQVKERAKVQKALGKYRVETRKILNSILPCNHAAHKDNFRTRVMEALYWLDNE